MFGGSTDGDAKGYCGLYGALGFATGMLQELGMIAFSQVGGVTHGGNIEITLSNARTKYLVKLELRHRLDHNHRTPYCILFVFLHRALRTHAFAMQSSTPCPNLQPQAYFDQKPPPAALHTEPSDPNRTPAARGPGGDQRRFKSLQLRYAAPVLAGQTLILEAWEAPDAPEEPLGPRVGCGVGCEGAGMEAVTRARGCKTWEIGW